MLRLACSSPNTSSSLAQNFRFPKALVLRTSYYENFTLEVFSDTPSEEKDREERYGVHLTNRVKQHQTANPEQYSEISSSGDSSD